jgi:hypothetical protein
MTQALYAHMNNKGKKKKRKIDSGCQRRHVNEIRPSKKPVLIGKDK